MSNKIFAAQNDAIQEAATLAANAASAKAAAKAAEIEAKAAAKKAVADAKAAEKTAKEQARIIRAQQTIADKQAREAAKKEAAKQASFARTLVIAEQKAVKEAEKVAKRQAKIRAREAKEAAYQAARAAHKANKPPMQNGVRRPKASNECGKIWAICDAISMEKGVPALISEIRGQTDVLGYNAFTVQTQHARWRKFNGIKGWQPKPIVMPESAVTTPSQPAPIAQPTPELAPSSGPAPVWFNTFAPPPGA